MSERLNKLQQQKRLIEQHLNWLDQEIAAESRNAIPAVTPPLQSPQTVAKPTTPNDPITQSVAPNPPQEEKAIEELSEKLISKYATVSDRREMDPKLGCVLYFAAAFGFIVAVIYAIYWFGYR